MKLILNEIVFQFFFNKLYFFFLNQCTKNRVLKQKKKTFKIIFKIDENNKRKKNPNVLCLNVFEKIQYEKYCYKK